MGGVTTNDSLSSRVEEVTHLLMYVSTYIDRILFLAYTKTIDSVTSQSRLIMILLSEEIIKDPPAAFETTCCHWYCIGSHSVVNAL